MLDLSRFLEKFKKIKNPKLERELVARVVSKVLGIEIEHEDVGVKEGVVVIKKTGKIKSELYLRKQEILKHLKIEIPHSNIREIK